MIIFPKNPIENPIIAYTHSGVWGNNPNISIATAPATHATITYLILPPLMASLLGAAPRPSASKADVQCCYTRSPKRTGGFPSMFSQSAFCVRPFFTGPSNSLRLAKLRLLLFTSFFIHPPGSYAARRSRTFTSMLLRHLPLPVGLGRQLLASLKAPDP